MRVLVVDDEPSVRTALRRALTLEGLEVDLATNGIEAIESIGLSAPDAVILDVLMPEMDGLEVCRVLRERSNRTPILMLTARDAVKDRVEGLDAGADDYLVKPFALEELLARIRALLRRTGTGGKTLWFADLVLDTETLEVQRGDRSIALTRTELPSARVLHAQSAQGALALADLPARLGP